MWKERIITATPLALFVLFSIWVFSSDVNGKGILFLVGFALMFLSVYGFALKTGLIKED